jgi:hypothetical protein
MIVTGFVLHRVCQLEYSSRNALVSPADDVEDEERDQS